MGNLPAGAIKETDRQGNETIRTAQVWDYAEKYLKEVEEHGLDADEDIFLEGINHVDKGALVRGWLQHSELIGVYNTIRLTVQGKTPEGAAILDMKKRKEWVRNNLKKKIPVWMGFDANACERIVDSGIDTVAKAYQTKENPYGLPPDVRTARNNMYRNEDGSRKWGKFFKDILGDIINPPTSNNSNKK